LLVSQLVVSDDSRWAGNDANNFTTLHFGFRECILQSGYFVSNFGRETPLTLVTLKGAEG